jgi:hypothetical protein
MSLSVEIGPPYKGRPERKNVIAIVPKDPQQVRSTQDILFISYFAAKGIIRSDSPDIDLKISGSNYYIMTLDKIRTKVKNSEVMKLINRKALELNVV